MTFEEWLGRLVAVLSSDYGDAHAFQNVNEAKDAWREFYDDGYSPAQAVAEDTAAGLQ
jgi:hypothetical protein